MAVFRVEGRDNFEFREMRHVFIEVLPHVGNMPACGKTVKIMVLCQNKKISRPSTSIFRPILQ